MVLKGYSRTFNDLKLNEICTYFASTITTFTPVAENNKY